MKERLSSCAETVLRGARQSSAAVAELVSGEKYRCEKSRGSQRKLSDVVTRRSGKKAAETGEGFELERVVSCGNRDEGWRTKLDLDSCESFDHLHWPSYDAWSSSNIIFRSRVMGTSL